MMMPTVRTTTRRALCALACGLWLAPRFIAPAHAESNHPQALAATDCRPDALVVAFSVTNGWDGGYVGDVTLTARERAVDGWTLRIRRTNRITEVWGAKLVERGGYYELTPEAWTRSVAKGQRVSFGFRAEGRARRELAECTVDGLPCFRTP